MANGIPDSIERQVAIIVVGALAFLWIVARTFPVKIV